MARAKRRAANTASRAVAAMAQLQVKKVKTTNQAASSGKWVYMLCDGRVPCAYEGKSTEVEDCFITCIRTTSKYNNPIASQKDPHMVLIIVTRVSLASKPLIPAMN